MKCQEFDDLIVDYIEENLTLEQRKVVENHLTQCRKCRAAFDRYKETVQALNNLPRVECPDKVVDRIFHSIDSISSKESVLTKIIQLVSRKISWKLSIAMGVAVIVLNVLIFYEHKEKENYVQHVYSTEEIDQALKDVQLALGYINRYALKTGKVVEDNAIYKSIVKPIRKTLGITF